MAHGGEVVSGGRNENVGMGEWGRNGNERLQKDLSWKKIAKNLVFSTWCGCICQGP